MAENKLHTKLYGQYRKILDESDRGELLQAWFTSFEISPSFVEKYLLPLFTDSPEEIPYSFRDYEIVQRKITDQGIDICFFCDARFLLPEIKKTAVRIFGVDQAALGKRYKEGFYHPKVTLLRFEKSALLIAGSANLTLSGWARNIEAVTVCEIKGKENARRISEFFIESARGAGAAHTLSDGIAAMNAWANSLPDKRDDWQFLSAFDENTFLDSLFQKKQSDLTVWSPYFSGNMAGFVSQHLADYTGENQIVIVPDISSGKKIRIRESDKSLLKSNISFMLDNDVKQFDNSLVHAKVWVTEGRLACGSWNMSHAGTGTARNENNIEAGVLRDISTHEAQMLKKRLQDFSDPVFMSSEELEAEKPIPLFEAVACVIVADWRNAVYTVDIDRQNYSDWHIALPGFNRMKISDIPESGLSFIGNVKSLLKDHYFHLYKPNEKQKSYTGVICEINQTDRPADRFASFDDLLYGWISDNPQAATERHVLTAHPRHSDADNGDGDNDTIDLPEKMPSYYVLFRAAQAIRSKLSEVNNNHDELHRLIAVYPGSVVEWCEYVSRILASEKYSLVFRWFLARESYTILHIIKNNSIAKRLSGELHQNSKDIIFNRGSQKWAQAVMEDCGYAG